MDEILARAGIFQGVEPTAVSALTKQLQPVDFPRGHTVFAEGEPGDRLYIIISGKVKIGRRSPDGRENLLTIMGPSDMFGELSIFDPGPRTSSATTITEVRAVSMDREALRAWIADRPEIAEQLLAFFETGEVLNAVNAPTKLMKELGYGNAYRYAHDEPEAYAAGELKHGPLALVDKYMPVIAIAPKDSLIEKLKSNLQEVKARGGELYVFADAGSEIPESEGVHILHLPEHYGMLSPILHVIPLQLLSYHAALVKGTDVDKPRNLAKSVTVE